MKYLKPEKETNFSLLFLVFWKNIKVIEFYYYKKIYYNHINKKFLKEKTGIKRQFK